MKLSRPILSQTRERYFEWILVGLILILGSLLFYQALPFLNGTLGAITLYILLRRVNLLLSTRFSPSIAPWIITIAVTTFVLIPLSIFLWYLIDLVQSVNFDVQVIIKRFTDTIRYLERTTNLQIVSEKSVAFITAKGTAFVNSLMAGINNAAINLFTTILILFFLLAGGVKMEIAIARCLPFSDNNKHTIINKVSTIVRSNAIGIPLLAMIQGGVAAVGYWICGVNNPIEFGALTGFASMIPIVGSMLVWIPLAIVQYFEQGTAASIYVALYGVIVISQCDNVLRMFMQKRMADTHPLVTIFGVIAGLPLFGFMGLIFGPLLVAMFLLFLEMFIKQYIIADDLSIQDAKAKRARTFDPQSSIKAKHKSQEEFIAQATIKSKQLKNRAQIKHQNKQELLSGKQSSPASQASSSTSSSASSANSASTSAASAESSALASTATNTSANAQAKANNKASDKAITSTKNTAKNKADFKTSKAEIKQQKRQAAKLRVQEEQEANERELAKKTLSVPKREPINLAERSLLNFNHIPDNNHLSDDAPGKNMVARAVSQAINSFDKFDDLDGNMAFGGSELFKDDYLTANTKQQLAKKRSLSKMDLEHKPIPFVQANDLPSSARPSSDEATKAQANATEHSSNEASNEPVLSSKPQDKGSKEQKTERPARNARSNRKDRKDKAHRNDRSKKSERNERSERNDRPERNERSEHNSRKDRAHAKASDRHNKKNDRSSSYERNKSNSNSKANRTRKSHDSHKSRRDNLGYQTMRSERNSAVAQEPVIRTVVSHQYGNFDLNKSRSSGLKTQLVSMHTAKGTVMAQQPRRRPSKRRPYH